MGNQSGGMAMSGDKTSPSSRWSSQHGRKKFSFEFRQEAQNLADELNARPRPEGQAPQRPYACKWGGAAKYGETAVTHWHVGRSWKD